MNKKLKQELLKAQQNEITEYFIYQKLSTVVKDKHNQAILAEISRDELKHYHLWKKYTHLQLKPNKIRIGAYSLITRLFGLTFGVKLMEKGERSAQVDYDLFSKDIAEVKGVIADEEKHEQKLIALLEEDKLSYMGSIVLGLNDALVELTGALAGFTLALQNSRLIAVIGLITGFAASLSMAASEYLSTTTETSHSMLSKKTEGKAQEQQDFKKHPFRASVYTGIAYILTVSVLVLPFWLFSNVYLALGFTIMNALFIIFCFTFYVSIARGVSFRKKFLEMAILSLGVAAITFIIGYFIRMFFGVDV